MLTDEQFDELADKLLKKIAPKLGVELEEEPSDTEIKDQNGAVYDLETLVRKKCLINNGHCLQMSVHDYGALSEYWVSSSGTVRTSRELAELIKGHEDDPDYCLGIYTF